MLAGGDGDRFRRFDACHEPGLGPAGIAFADADYRTYFDVQRIGIKLSAFFGINDCQFSRLIKELPGLAQGKGKSVQLIAANLHQPVKPITQFPQFPNLDGELV